MVRRRKAVGSGKKKHARVAEKNINRKTFGEKKKALTPIHPVDILLSLCKGLASVGSSVGDSTARGSSRALGSASTENSGSAMPTFSRGGEKEGGGDDENSSSASSPPPVPGLFGRPRLQSVVA